ERGADPGTGVVGAERPQPPRPSASAYLGLLVLAVAAFAFFWWSRESTDVLFLPLGGITLWAPQNPLLGLIIMLGLLAGARRSDGRLRRAGVCDRHLLGGGEHRLHPRLHLGALGQPG